MICQGVFKYEIKRTSINFELSDTVIINETVTLTLPYREFSVFCAEEYYEEIDLKETLYTSLEFPDLETMLKRILNDERIYSKNKKRILELVV